MIAVIVYKVLYQSLFKTKNNIQKCVKQNVTHDWTLRKIGKKDLQIAVIVS